MQSIVKDLVETMLPSDFQGISLFEPLCDQVSAYLSAKLQETLNVAKDDEDKDGIVNDFLYDFFKGFRDVLDDEDELTTKYASKLENVEIPSEMITIPVYRCRPSKGEKKHKKSSSSDSEKKAINPKTGSKVTITGTARVFKGLVKEGLLTKDGEFTMEGQRVYAEFQENKPKKIDHPNRRGKINLGGKAYKNLVENGWIYDDKTEIWTEPELEDSEKTEEIEKSTTPKAEIESVVDSSNEETTSTSRSKPKKMVPHPTMSRTLVFEGRGFKSWLSKGWSYDDETEIWTEPAEE